MVARAAVAATAIAALALACRVAPPREADLLIRGGRIVDGTGSPEFVGDLLIVDGRIASIGRSDAWSARRTIEADGLVVSPGIIDLHSHADLILLGSQALQQQLLGAKLAQGVTTILVGNCGLGVAPATDEAATILSGINGWMTPDGIVSPALSISDYLDRLEAGGVVLNVGTLAPHGPIRISAMGLAPGPPSDAARAGMAAAVERSLAEGAWGLSVGLIYPPGMYSATAELIELARIVATHDALFTAHVRGSSETLLPATEELITIARASGARTHHSHLEAVGRRFWSAIPDVLALEDSARATGLRLSHDVFPYTRAATMMSAIFPPWALEGGAAALLARLRNPATRLRIRADIENRVPDWPPWEPGGWPHNLVEAVGWDGIRIASVRPGGAEALVGRSVAELASDAGRDPFDLVADLMLSENGQIGQQVDEISGRDDETAGLLAILTHPSSAVISDAEDYGRGSPHPAHAGAFARALRWSRESGTLALESTVRKMTAWPAAILGLADRGTLRVGAFADVLIFDPARIVDRATWNSPRNHAAGVQWVLLNGRVVLDDGELSGIAAGQVLRRPTDR